jgi:hypothetical protein
MMKTKMKQISASMVTGLSMLVLSSSASAQYGRDYGRGAYPASGACFYEDINYGGRYFCTAVGDAAERVPSSANDEISSIRLFGNAEVVVFRDGNMNGEARRFSSSVRDMRRSGFNDRLTSYVVQPRGYARGYGGGYGGGYDNGRYSSDRYNDAGRGGAYGGYDGRYGGSYGDQTYRGSRDGVGSRYTYQQAENMVRQAYRRVFQREPDAAARPWVNEVLKNNWSPRQLDEALRNTPEGRGRY